MSNEKVRVGLVGCGRIAQTHFEALSQIPFAVLTGVCDVDEAKAKAVAEQFRVPHFTDYKKLLSPDLVDAVIICTPPSFHKDQAVYALQKKIHVLCEKPLCLSVEDARSMIQEQEKAKVVAMPASKFCFCEDVIKARAILQSGVIGRVLLYENIFTSNVDMRNSWHTKKEISGGGVLIDNGAHSFDIVRYLFGSLESVQSTVGIQIQDIPVEDTVRVSLQMSNGVLGLINLSWSMQEDREDFVSVYGTEGSLSVGWKVSRYRLRRSNEWIVFGKGYSKVQSFVSQNSHFLECVLGQSSPRLTFEDGMYAVKAISRSYESLRQNRWAKVTD